jgi:hypothetical protein
LAHKENTPRVPWVFSWNHKFFLCIFPHAFKYFPRIRIQFLYCNYP